MIDDEAWKTSGACHPLEDATAEDIAHVQLLFFPGRELTIGDRTAIRNYCAPCPVREECRDYAITHGIEHGWWGGMSPRERRRFRAARNSSARAS